MHSFPGGAVSAAIKEAQKMLPQIECRRGEPLKNHTSFAVGGSVPAMFVPDSAADAARLRGLLSKYGISVLILGNGTNTLVNDSRPLDLIVIKTIKIDGVRQTGSFEIEASSGVSLRKLAQFAKSRGLSGLEFASGIPGSLGGAVSMNAGAYGSEMKDVIVRTAAYSCRRESIYAVEGEEHTFGYRQSIFTGAGAGDIILSSVLRLSNSDEQTVGTKMETLEKRRNESQPLLMHSAGSTFKRPKEGYAAELIARAGLKGFSIGGAAVSEKHSGFIVNNGTATFSEIIAVIEHVKATVFRLFGVVLETEIRIVY